MTECNTSPNEFFEALKKNVDGETELYVEIILAAADYENFIKLMRTYQRKINGLSSEEEDGGDGGAGGAGTGEAGDGADGSAGGTGGEQ